MKINNISISVECEYNNNEEKVIETSVMITHHNNQVFDFMGLTLDDLIKIEQVVNNVIASEEGSNHGFE